MIGVKSENVFKKKGKKKNTDEEGTIWGLDEEVKKEKEYMGGPIKIKITAEENFYSSFLKLSECVPIDIQVCLKKRYSHSEVEKKSSFKFFLKKCGLDAKADMLY